MTGHQRTYGVHCSAKSIMLVVRSKLKQVLTRFISIMQKALKSLCHYFLFTQHLVHQLRIKLDIKETTQSTFVKDESMNENWQNELINQSIQLLLLMKSASKLA